METLRWTGQCFYKCPLLKRKYVSNEMKYVNRVKVVQANLIVSHGRSDVERGFSESGNILIEDKYRIPEH